MAIKIKNTEQIEQIFKSAKKIKLYCNSKVVWGAINQKTKKEGGGSFINFHVSLRQSAWEFKNEKDLNDAINQVIHNSRTKKPLLEITYTIDNNHSVLKIEY